MVLKRHAVPAEIAALPKPVSAERLIAHMRRDKKVRDGRLSFVLARGVGEAFTTADVTEEDVEACLRRAGALPLHQAGA